MKTYDPSKPILYTHIPKCAGTSVVRLLKHWFGPQYHKLNQDETRDIILPRVETQDEQGNWLTDVKCIHGHFNHGRGYGLPYFYPEIDQYFTIVRDPFDLVCSMYFFVKGRSIRGEFWFRGQQIDIRDQFPTVERYIESYPYWLFDHLPRDLTIANYREKINEKFVYIGVFEDLPTSIANLGKILGKEMWEMPHINESVYDEIIPERLRKKFYSDYPLLKRIYDLAWDTYQDVQREPLPGSEPPNPSQSANAVVQPRNDSADARPEKELSGDTVK